MHVACSLPIVQRIRLCCHQSRRAMIRLNLELINSSGWYAIFPTNLLGIISKTSHQNAIPKPNVSIPPLHKLHRSPRPLHPRNSPSDLPLQVLQLFCPTLPRPLNLAQPLHISHIKLHSPRSLGVHLLLLPHPRSILLAPPLEILLKPPRRRARRIASQTREL
jgi:hypothetical protein